MNGIRRRASYKSTTLLPKQPEVEIHVIHPFSPLRNQKFELIERKRCWGEDRLLCFDEAGNYRRILTSWTDFVPNDVFEEASRGRAYMSGDSMVELASFLKNLSGTLST